MKINKVILGLGAVSLMLTSCDKAAEQDYTPAAGVATPPAYFSLDYESDITLEEEQTSFSIPVYRATSATAQDVPVTLTLTTEAEANGLFTLESGVEGQAGTTIVKGQPMTVNAHFAEGETKANLKFDYSWPMMEQLAGVEFNFELATEGNDTEYFLTKTDYTAMYVPWLSPDADPETGDATCYFRDAAIYSGFKLSGFDELPFKYEVEIQYNPIALQKNGTLIYRVMTPYANCPAYNSNGAFVYEGYNEDGTPIKNIMYINASDPDNVYLSDKNGNPQKSTEPYHTYYVLSPSYSSISYIDRVASYMNGDDYITIGTSAYYHSQGDANLNGYYDEEAKKIIFPEGHFMVFTDGYATTNDPLEVWFPGAKAEAEWTDLGNATITDNIVAFMDDLGDDINTYDVPVQQNIKDENLYRLLDPFTNNSPYDYATDDSYNIDIDVTNPNLVVIDLQATGYDLPLTPGGRKSYSNDLLNAAALLLYYQSKPWTEAEIIAQGYNDTFENNVITISNAMLNFADDEETLVQLKNLGAPATTIKLPAASGAPRYATSAAKNSTHKAYKAMKSKKTSKKGQISLQQKMFKNVRKY